VNAPGSMLSHIDAVVVTVEHFSGSAQVRLLAGQEEILYDLNLIALGTIVKNAAA